MTDLFPQLGLVIKVMVLTGKNASAEPEVSPTIRAKPAAVKQTETAFGQIKVVIAQQLVDVQSVSCYKLALRTFESADERRHFNTGHNDWPVA